MKRMNLAAVMVMTAVVAAGATGFGQVRTAPPAESEGVQLLRIDMRKALLEADAAPKVTEARAERLKYLQDQKDATAAKDLADAEVDLIEAQTAEKTASVNAKSVEAELKEAIKSAASIPARQPATADEVAILQMEQQKAQIQAAGLGKVANNRARLLAQLQAGKANAGQIADAQADVEATKANAALAALEVEAANVRVFSAEKSMTAAPAPVPAPVPAPAR